MAKETTIPQRLRGLLQSRRLVYLLGILATLSVIWLYVAAPAPVSALIQRLDYIIYDQRYSLMPGPERTEEHNIVIVDIDERSLQAEGQWPWDRYKLAELVRQLEDHGVLVTGFDITFPEPQRNPLEQILERAGVGMAGALSPMLRELVPELDADRAFADAIASPLMDVVLALSFSPGDSAEYGMLPDSIVEIDSEMATRLRLPQMAGYTANIPVLQEAATGAGIMNQLPDADGVVRRIPLMVRYQNRLYPTLALEMARVYFFEDQFSPITSETTLGEVLEGIRIGAAAGQYDIATDQSGQVLVPFVGRSHLGGGDHYSYVSATDVLHGDVDPQVLENALVLVGTTAAGLFDLRATPLESVFPGVEVHANVLNGLLQSFVVQEVGGESASTEGLFSGPAGADDRAFPYKPIWEPGAMLAVLAVLGGVLSMTLPLLGPVLLVLVSLALLVLVVAGNFWLWSAWQLDLSLTMVLLLIVLLVALNMAWGFFRERRTRQTIKGMFDQYVPPAHINAMLRDPDSYSFAGESREMTVLFSDIRNFTSISENLSASELKTLLNDFFTPMTGIIFEYQGTIDKYVGDMVMAFWGAPLRDEAHCDHAVGAALAMLEEGERLREEFLQRGLPEISLGVGINSGLMNVGDMGSEYRRSYTVLGDAVNLASRVEGLTRFYGAQCLIGETTWEGQYSFLCRRVDLVQVKGKEKPVQLWEPLCRHDRADGALRARVDKWHEALQVFYQQDWQGARLLLRELEKEEPDSQLIGIYLSRIEMLEHEPPGPDWDGVFLHRSK